MNQSSKNIDKYDVFGRFTFYKVAKSGFNIKDVYLKFPLTIEATGGYEVKKDGGSYVPDDYIPNGGLLELGKLPTLPLSPF